MPDSVQYCMYASHGARVRVPVHTVPRKLPCILYLTRQIYDYFLYFDAEFCSLKVVGK